MRSIAFALAALTALIAAAWFQPEAAAAEPVAALQARDARLFATGWRLARANAPYCRETVPAIGMLMHDAAAYDEPAAVREALGLTGDLAVQAIAPGSPAETAGLTPNATLLSLGTLDFTVMPPGREGWQRLTAAQDAVDALLAREGAAMLAWTGRGGAASRAPVAPVAVCASRFEVLSSGHGAMAEGRRVILGRNFPGFAYPEDQFAAAVAHELAHNLLGHRALLDREGRTRQLVRLTERDTDRLMPWLLHNAGYDPAAAIRFMQAWGPRHGGGLLRKRTHDGWDERVEHITAEIAVLNTLLASGAPADWSAHFREEARQPSD